MTGPFVAGERALLLDSKKRRYLIELSDDGEFHSHAGFVAHSDIIGSVEGTVVRSTKAAEYTVLRPTLEDFANRAKANVSSFLGAAALERYHVTIGDSYEGIDPSDGPFDRVVLDLPEPWRVVPHAETVLRAGGILLAYTPSITQAAQVREALKGRWIDGRTVEVLHRGWHIDGAAVRPDHRMVAHTGFLSVGRFLGKPEA